MLTVGSKIKHLHFSNLIQWFSLQIIF